MSSNNFNGGSNKWRVNGGYIKLLKKLKKDEA